MSADMQSNRTLLVGAAALAPLIVGALQSRREVDA